jgi:hypothetical protein
MNTTISRPRRARGTALVAAAIAAGVLSAPLALSSAYAAEAASVTTAAPSTDAASRAALYVGVRQVGVGDPIPVTVVGGAAGEVWEIVLVEPETTLGTLTIGADGTGSTLVSLPADSDPGSVAIVARSGGAELTTGLSSAGDAPQEAAAAPAPAPAPEAAVQTPAFPAGAAVGVAAGAALVAASVAGVVIVTRRHRFTP